MKKQKLVASLEYGRIVNGIWIIFLYAEFLMGILVAIGLVAISICENMLFLLGEWFPAFLCTVSVWLIVKYHRLNKKVESWLTDAVDLEAKSKCIASKYDGVRKIYKIMIKFTYNGQILIKYSGQSGGEKSNLKKKIYDAVYKKYIDRKIRILYSPKHDQVIVLK